MPEPVGPVRQLVYVYEQAREEDGGDYDERHKREDLAFVAGECGDEDAEHHGGYGQEPHDHEQHRQRLLVVVQLEEPDRLGQPGDGLEGREPQKAKNIPGDYLHAPEAVYEHSLHRAHRPLLYERDCAEQEGQKVDQEGRYRHGVPRHVEGLWQSVEEDLQEVHDHERSRYREHEEPRVPEELPDHPPCDEHRPAHYAISSFSIRDNTTASRESVFTSIAVMLGCRP